MVSFGECDDGAWRSGQQSNQRYASVRFGKCDGEDGI